MSVLILWERGLQKLVREPHAYSHSDYDVLSSVNSALRLQLRVVVALPNLTSFSCISKPKQSFYKHHLHQHQPDINHNRVRVLVDLSTLQVGFHSSFPYYVVVFSRWLVDVQGSPRSQRLNSTNTFTRVISNPLVLGGPAKEETIRMRKTRR